MAERSFPVLAGNYISYFPCVCCYETSGPVETGHERCCRGWAKALMVPHSDFSTERLKLVVAVASSLSQQKPVTIHKLLCSVIPACACRPAAARALIQKCSSLTVILLKFWFLSGTVHVPATAATVTWFFLFPCRGVPSVSFAKNDRTATRMQWTQRLN